MVNRREHGANQERDQDCGHESANRRTDDLAAEVVGKVSANKTSAVGNFQIESGTILLSLNLPLHSSIEQSEILGRMQRQQMP